MTIWQPTEEAMQKAHITAFMKAVHKKWGVSTSDYYELYEWSLAEPEKFWHSVWEYCRIISSRPWTNVLLNGDRMPGAEWFTGAQLNFAENLLRFQDDHPAIVFWNEDGHQLTLSYRELRDAVARLAQVLRERGVTVGDRVAAVLPNIPEAVIGMLAAASIGAVWSSCSPDFEAEGVIDRFGQIGPKILIATDGYLYKGKLFDCSSKLKVIVDNLPTLELVIVVSYMSDAFDLPEIHNAILYSDLVQHVEVRGESLEFVQLPPDHPVLHNVFFGYYRCS